MYAFLNVDIRTKLLQKNNACYNMQCLVCDNSVDPRRYFSF